MLTARLKVCPDTNLSGLNDSAEMHASPPHFATELCFIMEDSALPFFVAGKASGG